MISKKQYLGNINFKIGDKVYIDDNYNEVFEIVNLSPRKLYANLKSISKKNIYYEIMTYRLTKNN